jgi:hypothetical protein
VARRVAALGAKVDAVFEGKVCDGVAHPVPRLPACPVVGRGTGGAVPFKSAYWPPS